MAGVVKEVAWPMYRYATPIATIIQMAEATSYHADLVRSRGSEYAPPVRLLLEAGFFLSAPQLNRAQQARTLFVKQSLELFRDVDVLAGPMTPITAHKIGAAEVTVGATKMTPRAALTQYTRPYNLSGFPAMSVPCGFTSSQPTLPIGLQLFAKPFAARADSFLGVSTSVGRRFYYLQNDFSTVHASVSTKTISIYLGWELPAAG